MRSAIESVCIQEYFCSFDVADIDDVEQAVVDPRVGSDHHSAAEISGVGDAEIYRLERLFVTAVDIYSDEDRFHPDHFAQRRGGKIGTAANRLDRQPVENA